MITKSKRVKESMFEDSSKYAGFQALRMCLSASNPAVSRFLQKSLLLFAFLCVSKKRDLCVFSIISNETFDLRQDRYPAYTTGLASYTTFYSLLFSAFLCGLKNRNLRFSSICYNKTFDLSQDRYPAYTTGLASYTTFFLSSSLLELRYHYESNTDEKRISSVLHPQFERVCNPFSDSRMLTA
jgi:hypothetical protein